MIEQLAPEYGFSVHARGRCRMTIFAKARGADVAIEFSTPEAVLGNVEKLAALGVPVVVGTTGWLKRDGSGAGGGGEERQRAGLESEFFDRRECVFAAGAGGGAAAGGRASVWRMGLGDSSSTPRRTRRPGR